MICAMPTQTTAPTTPSERASCSPIHTMASTAMMTTPAHAIQGRRRTITIVMSALMPPRLQVAYAAVRPSGPTANQVAAGTSSAFASASTAAHTGSSERPARLSVNVAGVTGSRPRTFQKMHSQVVTRNSASAPTTMSG